MNELEKIIKLFFEAGISQNDANKLLRDMFYLEYQEAECIINKIQEENKLKEKEASIGSIKPEKDRKIIL